MKKPVFKKKPQSLVVDGNRLPGNPLCTLTSLLWMTSRRTPTKLDRFIAKRKSRWPCDACVIHARFARDEIINLAARRSAPRFARNKRYLCNPSCDRENQYKKYRKKSTCSLRATKRICEEIRGMQIKYEVHFEYT